MLDLLRYFFALIFLLLTIYLGIKGFGTAFNKGADIQAFKGRAFLYTAATFCGLISFELYYPSLAGLICVPIVLAAVWMEYLTVASLLSKK